MRSLRSIGLAFSLAVVVSGCAGLGPVSDGSGSRTSGRAPSGPALERVSPQDAARLRRVVEPLARASDKPPAQIRIGILSDRSINAANAGGGEFYVTRGLLDRASDEQLLAIMAHEFAHNDLGHVAKAQAVNTGVGIGAAILESVIPEAAIITPIAGTLITRAHSRSEELAADKHAVSLLRRVGSSKQALENTLAWLARMSGGGEGGGWFATHPGTTDRIQALRELP
jgi:putative metalloprotease